MLTFVVHSFTDIGNQGQSMVFKITFVLLLLENGKADYPGNICKVHIFQAAVLDRCCFRSCECNPKLLFQKLISLKNERLALKILMNLV